MAKDMTNPYSFITALEKLFILNIKSPETFAVFMETANTKALSVAFSLQLTL